MHPLDPVAAAATRTSLTRPRFLGLLAGAIGAALGFERLTGAAAQCRKKSARCDRSDQCCSNRCRRGFCYPKKKR